MESGDRWLQESSDASILLYKFYLALVSLTCNFAKQTNRCFVCRFFFLDGELVIKKRMVFKSSSFFLLSAMPSPFFVFCLEFEVKFVFRT